MLAAAKGGSSYILIIYALVFGALYFFYLRPRSKRQKARARPRRRSTWASGPRRSAFRGHVTKMTDEFNHPKDTHRCRTGLHSHAIARRFDPKPVDEPHDDTAQKAIRSNGSASWIAAIAGRQPLSHHRHRFDPSG